MSQFGIDLIVVDTVVFLSRQKCSSETFAIIIIGVLHGCGPRQLLGTTELGVDLRVDVLKAAGRAVLWREGKLGECVCLQFDCAQRENSEVIVSYWLVADTATKQITGLFVRGRQTHACSYLPSSVCHHT